MYKIVNTVTGEFYVGSSRDVMRRWNQHKRKSVWKRYPNNPMYLDMQRYGVDKFRFQILAPVMEEYLKQVEQEFIDLIQPTYNNNSARCRDVERYKEADRKYHREYYRSNKEEMLKANRKYRQTDKGKEVHHKANRMYMNQLCSYKGETLTLNALSTRFRKAGIEHPTQEAKKYLIGGNK